MNTILSFGAGLLLASAAIFLLLRTGMAARIIDRPNERSLHVKPVPLVGGLCLVAAALPVALAFGATDLWPLVALSVPLAVVSLVDDIRNLSPLIRFGVHAASAAIAVALYGPGNPFFALLACLAIIWSTNLYNFMDGSDALAGTMALIGFGAYAVAAQLHGQTAFAVLCAAIAGGSLGFLIFNFPPARVFMGDAGAIPLGFLASAIGLAGWRAGLWNALFPPLVFFPFLADASVTLVRRGIRGERVWVGHREHFYQRTIRSGLSHRTTAMAALVLMIASVASAFALQRFPPLGRAMYLATWLAASVIAMIWLDRRIAPMPPVTSRPLFDALSRYLMFLSGRPGRDETSCSGYVGQSPPENGDEKDVRR